jgi:hypothetical protein
MLQSNTGVLAFAHHADDQTETALMRLGRGTTLLGASGMKPFRRWGMGIPPGKGHDLEWVGYEGMNKWIIRPLLGVSKVRSAVTHFVSHADLLLVRIESSQHVMRTTLSTLLTPPTFNLPLLSEMHYVKY